MSYETVESCRIKELRIEELNDTEWCDFCGNEFAKYIIEFRQECYELNIVKKISRKKGEYAEFYAFICDKCYKKLVKALEKKESIQFY